jgi:hypothetical protein
MFSRIFSILAVLAMFTAFGCNEEEQLGAVDLNFTAEYAGEPLVILEKYDYEDGLRILFQRFNFYVSDIQLINDEGESFELVDIDFVEFDGMDTQAKAEAGYTISVNEVPAGSYSSIQVGLGVPQDMNATTEADYSDSHPLGKDSHYWSAWQSYIFTMINGKIDTNGDGMHDDASILYHAGSDVVYRTKMMTMPIEISADRTTEIAFQIDLKELLRDGAGYIDVLSNPDTHDITNLDLANKIHDNFVNAIIQQQ